MKTNRNRQKWIKNIAVFTAGVLLFTGCAFRRTSEPDTQADIVIGREENMPAATPQTAGYDSVDTAIVVRYDTEEKTISLRNLETGRQYTLSYDGTTRLSDKNGQALTMAQLKAGEIVDVAFRYRSKSLVSLMQSPDAFLKEAQTDYALSETGRSMTVNGVQYRLADDLAIFSDGVLIELMDLSSVDALTLRGFDYEIHSICVDRGHGYLRLKNDESFIGGWIEVGTELIVPITENMLLTVPEGDYEVSVSGEAGHGTMSVSVCKNQEQTLDVGEFAVEVKEGKVYFDVTPADASVYVDSEKVDITEAVPLTYGVHFLMIRADGYETMVKYLSVGQETASLAIRLEKASADSDEDEEDANGDSGNGNENGADGNGSQGNPADETTGGTGGNAGDGSGTGSNGNGTGGGSAGDGDGTGGSTGNGPDSGGQASEPEVVTAEDGTAFYVSVSAPEQAEVYVDGIYVGIAPVRFKKVPGSHEITLRRNGYQTRSYTIQLDEEKKDVTYSFSELLASE
ncbi:MAG: PEGA domain-containing protein [Clostridium sp.]|nr:PEGA domain-containing protein [Clostridium sp.]